jgi:hypothetical protein
MCRYRSRCDYMRACSIGYAYNYSHGIRCTRILRQNRCNYNDYDVVVTWIVVVREQQTIAQETTLMPGQSNSYPSRDIYRVVTITTKIYLDNHKWVYTEFAIPSQVYDATYTISQLRGPQSNITSTTGMLNVTTDD